MLETDTFVFTLFLIFTGAAFLSTLVLYTRQSLLVAYILLGVILGPWGLKIVPNAEIVKQIGDVGIIFLLFLLGLHLQPQNLLHMLRKVTWVALFSSVLFMGWGFGVSYLAGYGYIESLIIGAAVMFSSTIIGLKLLPTTIMHHQHTGEVMISILLMQDIIAIVVLLLLKGASTNGLTISDFILVLVAFPGIFLLAYLIVRFVLIKLLSRFDRIQEYIFLISVGWCLGMAQLGAYFGLSEEVGAFMAGVVLASSPISLYIAECLKPLRDFFLVMFFFAIGAAFDFQYIQAVIIPAAILAVAILVLKPVVFYILLRRIGETPKVSREVGVRLGQASEFSLLVAYLALKHQLLGEQAEYFLQATTLITFIASSYIVVLRYPTPIAVSDKMRRD